MCGCNDLGGKRRRGEASLRPDTEAVAWVISPAPRMLTFDACWALIAGHLCPEEEE